MKRFMIVLKGFIIGSSMTVPGVSGGTMAILLGIYDKLIGSISNFKKDPKGNLWFLTKFCIGSGLGICSLALLIDWLLERFPMPVSFFFLGAVVGGIPALYKKIKPEKTSAGFVGRSLLLVLLGLAVVLLIGQIPQEGLFDFSGSFSLVTVLMWLVSGLIIAIALILPGISTSHMLLVMGMYDTVLVAIKNMQIGLLLLLVISTLIGVILITKPLEWTMNKFPVPTYCVIIGFVIGSLADIFQDKIIPAIPSADAVWWQWLALIGSSLVTLFMGIAGISYLSKFSNE